MFTPRRVPRFQIALAASIEPVAGPAADARRWARTLDLSRCGVGLVVPGGVEAGERLWVAIEERRGARRQLRRWRGTVANTQAVAEGLRVGIAFDAPERGPIVTLLAVGPGGREKTYRLDPSWAETANGNAPPPLPEPRRPVLDRTTRLAQRVAVLGFLADQWSRAWAFPAGLGAMARAQGCGILGWIFGQGFWANTAAGLTGLGLAGLVARHVIPGGGGRGRMLTSGGGGLLLAGLLGNAADRLTLGHTRAIFPVVPVAPWIGSVADVALVLGAGLCLGGWAVSRLDLARRRLSWRELEPGGAAAHASRGPLELDCPSAGGPIISTS
jgi:hypothetical protein